MNKRQDNSGVADPNASEKDELEAVIDDFFTEQFESLYEDVINELDHLDPQVPDSDFWAIWTAIFTAFLVPKFIDAMITSASTQADLLGVEVPHDALMDRVQGTALDVTIDLVDDMNLATQRHIMKAINQFRNDGNFELLIQNIGKRFTPERARNIAITETTKIFEAGLRSYQEELRIINITTDRLWHTMNDARVCPICEPNHLVLESEGWTALEPGWAHPGDRCWSTLEIIRLRAMREIKRVINIGAPGGIVVR